jgi:glycosyltransferase involved in cell wall biosynthesis
MSSTINFVVPPLHKTKFSGGAWCVFEYASGLAARGHHVRIVPILPSHTPQWFLRYPGEILNPSRLARIGAACASLARAGGAALTFSKQRAFAAFSEVIYRCSLLAPGRLPYPIAAGIALHYFEREVPAADITVATSFNTARAVSLTPGTRKFYFAQHFEPYFKNEFPNPDLAESDALQSYRLGLRMIANSSWLQQKLKEETGNDSVPLCTNAIDLSIFNGSPKIEANPRQVTVISYGGRNAEWKGFRDMCAAMALARKELPNTEITWKVYGDALLPPDNPIAPYQSLGFLNPKDLAEQYRRADILLSASWYESFPLFPLEAMACGLPVVTTSLGTEDYAVHGKTAEIVRAQDPEGIARGLVQVITDSAYARRIAEAGCAASHDFTWDRAVSQMEQLLHQ